MNAPISPRAQGKSCRQLKHRMSAQQWEQIAPDLFGWRSGSVGAQQPVHSFLWRKGKGAILIDPAADLSPATLRAVGLKRVTDVVITHVQEENVAGCGHFPEARIHVPDGDEYLTAGRAAYENVIEKWLPPWDWTTRGRYRGHLAGARNERPAPHPLRVNEPLVDGAVVASFQVRSTPGHGKNAVTLIAVIDGQRIAFCGDLICGEGQLWNWFDCDWDYGNQSGQRTLQQSVERLLGEKLDLLCSGSRRRDSCAPRFPDAAAKPTGHSPPRFPPHLRRAAQFRRTG